LGTSPDSGGETPLPEFRVLGVWQLFFTAEWQGLTWLRPAKPAQCQQIGEDSPQAKHQQACSLVGERRANGMACSFANFDLSRVAFIAE